ncbi:hypothetical protein OIU34_20075 [Pararhizobium sp. BT-229]|uniref:hypothetical protein n=1 Tax=Pararhizobium sp. BT-229 TaxID=2986923 RepID=UPI0021F6D03C|nr:hypothetical protein [Pararhizobium sp. BT-229]MCV9964185.1 hypothetical protein [Pararhizobium sp. BT-229]
MQLNLAFLNHFFANTKTDPKVKERIGWAAVDVEIQDVPKSHLEQVFQDNDGYHAGFGSDRAYAFDDHYWVIAEATNGIVRGRPTEKHSRHRELGDKKGWPLANFDRSAQRAFAWAAFEFRLFSRLPAPGIYATEPRNFRNYNPANKVEWDDRAEIEARAKRYFERNLLACEDTIYCRIDRPCIQQRRSDYDRGYHYLGREYTRVLTPHGGMGASIIDFEEAYRTIDDIRAIRRKEHYDRGPEAFFNPIPDRGPEPSERTVIALFADLFSRHPWYASDRKLARGSAKAAKALARLHELWLGGLEKMDDAILDEAAQLMIGIAGPGPVATALQEWLDRPVSLWTSVDTMEV